ncbi:MAG TPA: ABC transporter permease subunit [Chthoniobacteraceae bacterium]|nr:ABC transporter permease subunit [Chthoniobacteraceae bacterium]
MIQPATIALNTDPETPPASPAPKRPAFTPPAPGRFTLWCTLLRRELRTALLNRFVHLLSLVTLAVGIAPLFREHAGESAPYFLIQAILYLIPLFALLTGAGSAQSDLEERPFLLTQPVGRLTLVLGKWSALWLVFSLASGLLVLPSALGPAALGPLGLLWLSAVESSAIFLALGMALGFSTDDRVKAHLALLCLWLFLLAGLDLIALSAVQAGFFSSDATPWLLVLMLNPLDAFRIGALFSMEQVPLELSKLPPPGQWWLENPNTWFALLAALWTAAALGWCWWRLHRTES